MNKYIILFAFILFPSFCFAKETLVYDTQAKISAFCDGAKACIVMRYSNKAHTKVSEDYTIFMPYGLSPEKEGRALEHERGHILLELLPVPKKVRWNNLFKRKGVFCASDIYLDSRYSDSERSAECFSELVSLMKTTPKEFWGTYLKKPEVQFVYNLIKDK